MNARRNDPDRKFEPTFTGGRQERKWIQESLHGFYVDRWFSDVLYRVKGGKEATVYCCRADPSTGLDLLAAKVFRPRIFRAMSNDALYKLGRGLITEADMGSRGPRSHRDRRSLSALKKKSRHGRELDTTSWCRHEYRALEELHAAGADVPKPLACSNNAILMEFVGDEEWGAPVLQSVRLGRDEALALFARLVRNVEILLSRYRIHADLSAYNVLYWQGEIRLIDFPQAVDALRHPTAFELFSRDIDRLCRYFARCDVPTDPVGLAHHLWSSWIGW